MGKTRCNNAKRVHTCAVNPHLCGISWHAYVPKTARFHGVVSISGKICKKVEYGVRIAKKWRYANESL